MIIGPKYPDSNNNWQFLYFCSQFQLKTQEGQVRAADLSDRMLASPPPTSPCRSRCEDHTRSKPVLSIYCISISLSAFLSLPKCKWWWPTPLLQDVKREEQMLSGASGRQNQHHQGDYSRRKGSSSSPELLSQKSWSSCPEPCWTTLSVTPETETQLETCNNVTRSELLWVPQALLSFGMCS